MKLLKLTIIATVLLTFGCKLVPVEVKNVCSQSVGTQVIIQGYISLPQTINTIQLSRGGRIEAVGLQLFVMTKADATGDDVRAVFWTSDTGEPNRIKPLPKRYGWNDLLDSMKDAVEQARADSAAPQGIFTEVKKVFDPTGAGGDEGGFSVAISGDTAIVGVRFGDAGATQNTGAAFIIERNQGGENNWGAVKKLTAFDGVSGDEFGFSVGISGDTAIVGAPFDDTGAMTDQGAAYIFERNTGGANFWGEFQKLTPSDGVAGDRFGGEKVLGENNRVIVGANFADINSFSGGNAGVNSPLAGADQGAVYIFQGNLLAPTAAPASISGRVTTARGRGISGAAVTLVGGNLTQLIRARTTSFGYFRFDDVPVGATYFLSVSAKRFTFANSSMVLNLHEEFTEANFVAEE